MNNIRVAITGVGGFVPEYILNNFELSNMVDTSDEWIMQRIGISERRILKQNGEGASYLGTKAVNELLKKTNTAPDEIEFLICCTITPDMPVPAMGNIICDNCGLINAFTYDLNAACSGFVYGLETARRFIESGGYKKIVIVGADMMSSITDYTDRTTCPLFGDGAGAVLVEPVDDSLGIIDSILSVDGSGVKHLHMKAGGSFNPASHDTVDTHQHFIYQEGQTVFKIAVSQMADTSIEIMKRNNITADDLVWLVPHQANMRIIEAVSGRMGLIKEKVMINIQRYGNTTAATIPLCLWDFEDKLKKGDNIIITSFGAGFSWGTILLKWAYDGK
jgi:3-oxoacyl-[acyl-carrier-protein] synthase-3